MAVDAENRLYMAEALEPVRSLDEALVEGVLKTIERGKFVLAEVPG